MLRLLVGAAALGAAVGGLATSVVGARVRRARARAVLAKVAGRLGLATGSSGGLAALAAALAASRAAPDEAGTRPTPTVPAGRAVEVRGLVLELGVTEDGRAARATWNKFDVSRGSDLPRVVPAGEGLVYGDRALLVLDLDSPEEGLSVVGPDEISATLAMPARLGVALVSVVRDWEGRVTEASSAQFVGPTSVGRPA